MQKQTKQPKKQKHAAKPWSFTFRGNWEIINVKEIAETLSRSNPVAVVTLLPAKKKDVEEAIVVIHHSLIHKFHNVHGDDADFYGYIHGCADNAEDHNYLVGDGYAAIVLHIELVSGILNGLSSIKQGKLRDTTEYTAAVNYPKV